MTLNDILMDFMHLIETRQFELEEIMQAEMLNIFTCAVFTRNT